ncbi:hypothetical protein ACWFQ6_29210 [Streptomyces althioticus]
MNRTFVTNPLPEARAATARARSVLVADVPASPMAPHLVYGTAARDKDQQAAVAPYRDRDHTAWMAGGIRRGVVVVEPSAPPSRGPARGTVERTGQGRRRDGQHPRRPDHLRDARSWTRLHEHLGVPPGPLDFGMVAKAAAGRLAESDDPGTDASNAARHINSR